MVIYDKRLQPIWSTRTENRCMDPCLIVQSDGNVVLYDTSKQSKTAGPVAKWTTRTNGPKKSKHYGKGVRL